MRSAEWTAAFEPLLASVERVELDDAPALVYGVLPDLSIGYVNAAWWVTAWRGRAWGPGDDLRAAISGPLLAFYVTMFRSALATGAAAEHDYECSTPEQRRVYRMRALPIDARGVLLVHTLRESAPHSAEPVAWSRERFLQDDGFVHQCSYCRHVRARGGGAWLWVPELLEREIAPVTHGICRPCAAYYFGPGMLGEI